MTVSEAAREAGLDALPSQVAVLDATGEILFTNRAWREFAAANDAETGDHVGENYLAVCEESDDERANRVAEGLKAMFDGSRESVAVEYPCHGPDEERWFTMRAREFRHDGERYVLVMHLDITQRKRAELELRERNDRLETVAKVLSHDIRNPLNVALGHAELMEGDHADAVAKSLRRIETIVADALVLARGDDVADARRVELDECARRAWDHVETPDNDLRLVDSFAFDADPDLLGHVFENLFRNAVEHGGRTVKVGALGGSSDSERGFYVEDDGPGIPGEDRDDVFDDGYTSETANTGLGLAIVSRVADAHGWRVAVTEGADGGARIEVSGV